MTLKQLTLTLGVAAGLMTASSAQALTFTKAIPASGSTVESLSKIETFWGNDPSTMVDIDYDIAVTLTDESGKNVSVTISPDFDWNDWDNSNKIVYTISPEVSTPGTYKLNIPAGAVYFGGDKSEAATLTYTISGATSLQKLPLSFYPANGNTLNNAEFSYVNISFNGGGEGNFCDASKISVSFNGKSVNYETDAYDGTIALSEINLTEGGTFTVTVPEGTFWDATYDSTKEYGKINQAATCTYTITKITGEPDDGTPLEIKKIIYVSPEGVETDIMANGIDMIAPMSKLRVTSSKDHLAGLFIMEAFDNQPEDPMENCVISMSTIRKNDEGIFEYTVYSNAGYKLYEGHTYTFKFVAWDTDMLAPELRTNYGEAEVTVTGKMAPYVYSPVVLIKANPEPSTLETTTVITDPDQIFDFQFSAPLSEFKAQRNEGQGWSSQPEDVYSNTAKDHWYIKLGANWLNNISNTFEFSFTAKDTDGLVFKGNGGTDEGSYYLASYTTYLANPVSEVTPGSGEVESLQTWRGTGAYTYSVIPSLISGSGYTVASISSDNVTLYYNYNGQLVPGSELPDNVYDLDPALSEISLAKPITAPGKYTLDLPAGSFTFGSQFSAIGSKEQTLEYIINGTPAITGSTIKEGDGVNSLGIVGFHTDSYAAVKEDARMNIRADESNWISAPLTVVYNEEGAFVFADFSNVVDPETNQAPVFAEGEEYEIRIGSGILYLPGTDMEYPQISVRFVGSEVNSAAVATLTHVIAGHSTSVATVAKGSASTINLTPAANWKVGSVKFNGADVTENVANNSYTTPVINADSKLEVAFEYDGILNVSTGIDDVVTDFNLTVYSENGIIRIQGLTPGMNVKLYTIDGAYVADATAAESSLNFEVAGGTYVVLVTEGNKTEAVKIQNR